MSKELSKKEFIELIQEVVANTVKELGAKEIERKGVVFETPETPASEIEKMSPEMKIKKFFEAVVRNDASVVKDLGGDTTSGGAYLIPTEFANEIITELNQLTPMRKYATIFPVRSRVGEMPKETAKPIASRGTENQPATQSEPVFGQLTWALTRIDVLAKLSRELFADTPIQLVNYIRKAFADAIAVQENKDFTNGTGTNQPLGITKAGITAVAPATAGSVGYDDLVEAVMSIPAQYRRNLVVMTSNKGVRRLYEIKDTTGRPIYNVEQGTVMGMPVVENPDIPENLGANADETEIYIGDFSYYYVFEDGNIEIKTTTEGDALVSNQIWIVAFKRDDGKPVLTTPFVKISGIK